jgi:DNA-binding transcriptional regulator YdaS (Cro superfamily)
MKLNELTKTELEEIAEKAGTSVGYLVQIKNGHRKASPKLVTKIQEATNGKVSREDLRPDLWP